jgi:PKHD-type hydroxylase
MIVELPDVLTAAEQTTIAAALAAADFGDGKRTAGWHAQSVKQNLQVAATDPIGAEVQALIAAALQRHRLFQAVVRPRRVRPMLLNRYDVGMAYGDHTDNALMPDGADWLRSDVSMTLFLNAPEAYTGGELAIETSLGAECFKLAAGSAIVYPSGTLHQVREVTQGVRLAAVTWIQSWVRDPAQREILFDLDTARQVMFAQGGKSAEFDLVSKSLSNLLRQWAET